MSLVTTSRLIESTGGGGAEVEGELEPVQQGPLGFRSGQGAAHRQVQPKPKGHERQHGAIPPEVSHDIARCFLSIC